jgi:hypothetical protein
LTVDPELGPTGLVVIAHGTGFKPNTVVTLSWDTGTGTLLVASDAQGTFTTGMLVYHHDPLGPRHLVGTDAAGDLASAPFLVVAGSVQPGQFVIRR